MPTITISSSVTAKLEKLLLLLSSPQPGEVVNAARAIDRTLRATGTDWHDLVGRLAAAEPPNKPQNGYDDDTISWRAMRAFCLEHSHRLRERELKFVTSLDRWRGDLTQKQHEWLIAIHTRLRRHGV